MEMLNRIALLVTPRRRLLEWLNGVPDAGEPVSLDELPSMRTVYLFVYYENEQPDLQALIDQHWEEVFDAYLEEWISDESLWPTNRTAHTFRDWFGVELIDTVADADPEEPVTIEELVHTRCAVCERPFDEAPIGVALDGRDIRRLAAGELSARDERVAQGEEQPTQAGLLMRCCGPECAAVAEDEMRQVLEHGGLEEP